VSDVHFVVPEGIDDPVRPSGGNTYDREVSRGLDALGWSVHEHAVPGAWPRRDPAALKALADTAARISDGSVVLLDGLIASAAPEVLVPEARRLRLVVLVHMPLGHRPADEHVRPREREALSATVALVTTSAWSRRRLIELYSLPAEAVHVAEPGVDAARLATGTDTGGSLLCVGAVTFDKGHDLLLDALEQLTDLSWHCVCVGSLERAPSFAADIRARSPNGRVHFTGPRTGGDLDDEYAAADVLVLPSRAETYGMVVTEALARGLPVIASDVGGVSEAVGLTAGGTRPGLLVAPEDPPALAAALRAWLADAELRGRLRRAAAERRASLRGWSTTASALAAVLSAASG
jgi:glycosyltransferase involved in cell wall biosynthesis